MVGSASSDRGRDRVGKIFMAKDESTKGFLDSDKWRKRVPSIVKSLMDLILASVCLGLCLPLFVLIALAIKIDSPGPVFCRQKWIDA